MDFGYVLRRAWQIIWKFKILWVFGILASCGQAGSSGGSNSGYRFSGQDNVLGTRIGDWFNQLNPAIVTTLVILGIIVAIILVVLVILLGTVGRVGLIRGTMKAEQGAERLTFGELWRDGLTYFWRVFGLNIVIALLVFAVAVILLILGVVFSVVTLGLGLLCLLPLLCLLIPAWWIVTVIIEQANVALVVENLSISQALERGWRVVRDNLGSIIVMGLILVVGVSLIGGFVIGLPLLIVISPLAVGYATGTFDAIRNGWILFGIFFVIYLPFLLVLSGILRAYISSAWTLTYLRLTNKPSAQIVPAPGSPEAPMTPGETTAPEVVLPPETPEPPATPGA
ncbi:MAG: hypothetical protein ACM3H7_02205 [Acidobacteriaceae bacterium]